VHPDLFQIFFRVADGIPRKGPMIFSVPLQVIIYILCTVSLLTACTNANNSSRPPDPQAQGATNKCGAKQSSSDSANATQPGGGDASYDLIVAADLWADVKSVLGDHCTGCHAKFAEYDTASAKIDNYIKLTDLGETQEGFMPKGSTKLSLEERRKLILWQSAGMPNSGTGDPGTDGGEDITLDDGEGSGTGQDDSSSIDADGSDWGDDPPPPPKPDC
jgi:hypothetical protein